MEKASRNISVKLLAFLLAGTVLLGISAWALVRYLKQTQRKHYTIGVFYNSTSQTPEDLKVIRLIIEKKVEELNKAGGIDGRNIRIKYLDDKGNRDTTIHVVNQSIHDKTLIAYLGCWSSTKTTAVAQIVGERNIPFIGGYSVTSFAQIYPNMFTYEIGVDHFVSTSYNLLKARSKRVAFIGATGDFYSGVLHHKLTVMNQQVPAFEIPIEKWYSTSYKYSDKELDELVLSIKEKADFLYLSLPAAQTNTFLKKLWQHKVFIPVFCAFIDIPELDASMPGFKQAELYDISVFGIPSALNLRSQMLKDQFRADLSESFRLDFQLGLGALIADALGLIQTAAQSDTQEKNIPESHCKGPE